MVFPIPTKIPSFQYLIDIAYNITHIGEAKIVSLSELKQGIERQAHLRK